jgi:hypothetical protein
MISLILLVAALVLFILAAVGVPSAPRFNLVAAGLACVTAYMLAGVVIR